MKNRFALCFRPVGIETEESDHKLHAATDHYGDAAVSKSIVVSKEQKIKKMPAGIFGSPNPKFSCHPRRKIDSRKALSAVLKSLLFGSSPGIRVGDGKIRQITFVPSNESSNMADDKPVKKKKRDAINVQQVSSSSFSSTSSRVSSPSSTACVSPSSEPNDDSKSVKKRAFVRSRSNSFDQKKKPKTTRTKEKTCSSKEDFVLYLIILALFATVVWGKILAVLFTSSCLYIIPTTLNSYYWQPENAVKLPEMETSKKDKRRVIMEGLLERKSIQRALNF